MSTVKRKELMGFWWGRTMPEKHKELRNLSNLTQDELKMLQELKDVKETAEKHGIKLGFGEHVSKKDLFKEFQ